MPPQPYGPGRFPAIFTRVPPHRPSRSYSSPRARISPKLGPAAPSGLYPRAVSTARLWAQDADLETTAKLWAAMDLAAEDTREETLKALQALPITPDEAVRRLRAGPPLEQAEGGHFVREFTSSEGIVSTAHFWVPEDYDPKTPMPCMIFLHGYGADPQGIWSIPGPQCRDRGYLLIAPQAAKLKDVKFLPAVQRMMALAQYWWSYDARNNYGLLALDWAATRYPIDRDRVYLAGYSMGGYATWNLGARHHDRFAALAPFAGGEVSGIPGTHTRDDAFRLLENLRQTPVYLFHSTDDPLVSIQAPRAMMAKLEASGGEVKADIADGEGHSLKVGGEKNPRSAALFDWLAEKRRDPDPARFEHVALSKNERWAYRVELESFAGALCKVEVRREASGTIMLKAPAGASGFWYYDGDEAGRTLQVEGAAPVTLEKAPSWDTFLESWLARRDAKLTWAHRRRWEAPQASAAAPPAEEEDF